MRPGPRRVTVLSGRWQLGSLRDLGGGISRVPGITPPGDGPVEDGPGDRPARQLSIRRVARGSCQRAPPCHVRPTYHFEGVRVALQALRPYPGADHFRPIFLDTLIALILIIILVLVLV